MIGSTSFDTSARILCPTIKKLTFIFSPSFSQLDSSTWNIDMQELEYNPSKKDLTDARIHHLLAEELCKPYRRVSIASYLVHNIPLLV